MTYEEKVQKIRAIRWILNTRWISITVFFVFAETILRFIVKAPIGGPLWLHIVAPLFFYCSTFYMLWIMRDKEKVNAKTVNTIAWSLIPSDLVSFTILLYFLGGISSFAILFYFFGIIGSTALYGSPRSIFLTATASSILVIAEYVLEETGLLNPSPFRGAFSLEGESNPNIERGHLAIFVTTIHVAAILAGSIAVGFRQTLSELIQERNKISLIINVLPDAVIILDSNDKIILMNRAMEQLTGVSAEHVKSLPINDELVKEQPKLERLSIILKKKAPFFERTEFSIIDPYEKIFQMIILPLREEMTRRKDLVGTVRILHDISREKTISRLKSEFISIAAHQLRTPLSAIKWTFRLILDGDVGDVSEEQKKFLNRGYETNERMIKLVSDLLNVSRIEEGRFGYEFIKFSLEKVITDLLEDYKTVVDKKKVNLIYKTPSTPLPLVKIDPQRLRLAFQNIIENAINYTLPGGDVTISLKTTESSAVVEVRDSGIGIPKHQLTRLFTKFFRAENVMRMQTEGSGLGLYIVKNVVKRHGGDITITSQEGVGTTVAISLPLNEKDVPESEILIEEG